MEFIKWLRWRISGEKDFIHCYRMRRPRCDWSCNSVWGAYKNYQWNGRDFDCNQIKLDSIQRKIRGAVSSGDNKLFSEAAREILKWGRVERNVGELTRLGTRALPILRENARLLDPMHADITVLKRVSHIRMNSGWTKIYSLLLDDFPIYDGRVGAAMGYLVRLYCTESGISQVPQLLRFRWLGGRGDQNRNPSLGSLRFSRLGHSKPAIWAECNVWTSWVLGEVRDTGRFGELDTHLRLRAIEAALFMIGYELPAAQVS